MGSLVDDEDSCAGVVGQTFRQHAAEEPGTNDQVVALHCFPFCSVGLQASVCRKEITADFQSLSFAIEGLPVLRPSQCTGICRIGRPARARAPEMMTFGANVSGGV